MELVATWGWPAWTIAILVVAVVGWLLWRWLAALAFRYLQLGGLLRRYGWQANLPGGDGGRAAFAEQLRRQRQQGWAHLRQGWSGVREGYRTGVFGRTVSSGWQPDLTITGTYRGRAFVASQARRFELTSDQGRARRKVRRRASLELRAPLPAFEARTGLLTGQVRGAPPGLEELLRSRRFRVIRSDGGSLSTPLGPRLRRGRLLAGLAHLSTVADRLGAR
ncbi:hypothetical protein [Actinophytocola sp.]|uniref:hypothetical protein n=1 Tax=Actinophytocola sp. TaxID=1872138 RepID=UPI003D6BD27E